MVNAWSLLDSELNGTMDEDYPIMSKDDDVTIVGGDGDDTISITGSGLVGGADTVSIDWGYGGEDYITFDSGDSYVGTGNTASMEYGFPSKPQPNLKYKSQKYEEDAGIKDLKDYISSTYSGHYTSEQNNTQTLDLIQTVGDAESFCRSNAIKYLARYDKKGQAKRDILKAMHYCLLLYYFSGQTNNETPTRGYETF